MPQNRTRSFPNQETCSFPQPVWAPPVQPWLPIATPSGESTPTPLEISTRKYGGSRADPQQDVSGLASPMGVEQPPTVRWPPYSQLDPKTPELLPVWVWKPNVDWVAANPISPPSANAWSTWNLQRCGAMEAPSDALLLMDSEKKPAPALRASVTKFGSLPHSREVSFEAWLHLRRPPGAKSRWTTQPNSPLFSAYDTNLLPMGSVGVTGSPNLNWTSPNHPYGCLVRVPRDGVPIRGNWLPPRGRGETCPFTPRRQCFLWAPSVRDHRPRSAEQDGLLPMVRGGHLRGCADLRMRTLPECRFCSGVDLSGWLEATPQPCMHLRTPNCPPIEVELLEIWEWGNLRSLTLRNNAKKFCAHNHWYACQEKVPTEATLRKRFFFSRGNFFGEMHYSAAP